MTEHERFMKELKRDPVENAFFAIRSFSEKQRLELIERWNRFEERYFAEPQRMGIGS